MTQLNKTIELSNGVRLPFLEHGDPEGIPTLFLHGVTDSMHSYDPVLPHLPQSIHAFSLTQRGHGDADRPPHGYRTRDFADDIGRFLDAMKIDVAAIVGHSMGATNAQRFAIDHPTRTSALVLAGSFASYRANAELGAFWRSSISRLQDPIDAAFVREFQASTLARTIPQPFFDFVVDESMKVPASVWRAAFDGFMEDDFSQELSAIQAPTLLVWGDRDTLVPRRDQDIALGAIRDSRLVVYEGGGHALHWEQPARFAADLAAFVQAQVDKPLSGPLARAHA